MFGRSIFTYILILRAFEADESKYRIDPHKRLMTASSRFWIVGRDFQGEASLIPMDQTTSDLVIYRGEVQ